MADADLVIRGGTLVDGTSRPGVRADVAVTDGRVTEVGPGLAGARELDASGHVVAPGFVDVHSHYDAQLFWDPGLTPSPAHGVTTVVAGNCGFGLAPCRPDHRGLLARTLEHVEDMRLETLHAGLPWDWETFPEYLASVDRHGTVPNFACYVGHTPVRLWVMGEAGYERAATDDELAAMQRVVAEALAAGAVGFATSSSPTHRGDRGRPVPSRRADLAEVRALLAPLREQDRGVAALLPGETIRHDDVYGIAEELGRPLTWTALLTIRGYPWHERIAADTHAAHDRGLGVWPQVSCRPLTFRMHLAEPFTFNTRAAFAELMDGTREARLAAYRDPAWRRRAWDELTGPGVLPPRWDTMTVAESDAHSDLVGRRVTDLAEARGVTPLDVMLDLSLADDLRTRFATVLANDDPDAIATLLPDDTMLLGLADSGAHVSQLCDACLFTDLLGTWVREREVLTLEHAVHKMTGQPAGIFGFDDRGVVEPGRAADLVVFDPDTVGPGPLRRVQDFPADGDRLVADAPTGMRHVVVNGVPVRVDGARDLDAESRRPGRVLGR